MKLDRSNLLMHIRGLAELENALAPGKRLTPKLKDRFKWTLVCVQRDLTTMEQTRSLHLYEIRLPAMCASLGSEAEFIVQLPPTDTP